MQEKEGFYLTVDEHRQMILDAERYIWEHPETGFREWNTHAYLKEKMTALGYTTFFEPGDIPGFYVDIDFGRPGPKIGIFAEMDALLIPEHPQCDPKSGAVHACAHHCQCAAMLGVAAALAKPHAGESLCGSVRLYAVPAEECIESSFRTELMEKGILHFYGGKQEFMARGYLDGVDLGMMIHTGAENFVLNRGCVGTLVKTAIFHGKASHGASPAAGINALYAATNALAAANALREQFGEDASIRFHPLITDCGKSVNVIPAHVRVESILRASKVSTLHAANAKLNRAFAGSALAMGCKVDLSDKIGYMPRVENSDLQSVFCDVAGDFFPPEKIRVNDGIEAGGTDMGDVSQVIPSVLAYVPCSRIPGHTARFVVEDHESACVTNAKLQLGFIAALLSDGAARAKAVLANADTHYKSIKDYLSDAASFSKTTDAVAYTDDGCATVSWN